MQDRLDLTPAFEVLNGEYSYAHKYLAYYHDQDPFDITRYLVGTAPLHSASRCLSKVSTCDMLNYDAIMHSEYYVDFCLPQKCHHALVVRLDGGPSLRATLAIHRGKDDEPFPLEAVKMMDMLSPHLSANLRRTVDGQVVSALNIDDNVGLVILDEHACVLYCNPLAEHIILSLRSGTACPTPDDIVSSTAHIEGQTVIETAGSRYTVDTRLVCSPNSDAVRIVQIRQTHEFDTPYGERLRARFGFSERETEVLFAVIQGHRNKEISRRLFVSEHTVKKHIQNMARKANVGSRTALVHAALQELNLLP